MGVLQGWGFLRLGEGYTSRCRKTPSLGVRVSNVRSGMPAHWAQSLDRGPENKVHCRGRRSRPSSTLVLGARTHKMEEGGSFRRHRKRSSLNTASAGLVSSQDLFLQDWHTGMWTHMCVYV